MIVVSDTSPVSNLIIIAKLDLLRQLFGSIIIPVFVDEEIKALKRFGKDLQEYDNANWIHVQQPTNQTKVNALKSRIDEGEAEAIALALELHCDLLLIDERRGSAVAKEEGFETIGLTGVLVKAKQEGIINELKPVFQELLRDAGFWLGKRLLSKILLDNNETP